MQSSVRIILADDHKILRQGLRALIEKQPDMEVMAEVDNGRDAVRLARELAPNIVIMDVGMPDMTGIEATRLIAETCPDVKIIGLTMHSELRFAMDMLKAGASGYLIKDCELEELERAIRTVMEGGIYLTPVVTGAVVGEFIGRASTDESLLAPELSDREREVLCSIAEGKSAKETAFDLGLSVKTVETHRKNIMSKLSLHSVAELTKYAIREGLTSLES
jgi:two-component system, NarL family, response regulator NreC